MKPYPLLYKGIKKGTTARLASAAQRGGFSWRHHWSHCPSPVPKSDSATYMNFIKFTWRRGFRLCWDTASVAPCHIHTNRILMAKLPVNWALQQLHGDLWAALVLGTCRGQTATDRMCVRDMDEESASSQPCTLLEQMLHLCHDFYCFSVSLLLFRDKSATLIYKMLQNKH